MPKDEKEVLRPENNPKIVQRERMCFYLKELGYTQKLPSRIKYSFEFISKEGKSLMMNGDGVLFIPQGEF